MASPRDRITTLIIAGASGDLTSRLLLPGLASLLASGRGRHIRLIGFDRGDLTDAAWRRIVTRAFAASPSELGERVARDAVFVRGDATDGDDLQRVLAAADGRAALYFAVPPAVAAAACAALKHSTLKGTKLPPGLTFAMEKPFGTDRASAERLNRLLETMVSEKQIFRVDHFLGKSTVLDLIGLRFANRYLESIFHADDVERVDIVADEQLGLEGRAGYYDHAGALIDMIQSHLLQALALVAMEPPSSVESEDLRGSMALALRATRPWKADGTASRRARYTAGRVGRRQLPSYVSEPGVDPARQTETLAEMTVAVDTARWAGIPFTLRSGKALGDHRQEIAITLKDVRHLPTGLSGPSRKARLVIGMNPGGIRLDLALNGRADPFELEWETLEAVIPKDDLTSYGEVLGELLDGDVTLSVRGDVAEQCWRIVTPVLKAWRSDRVRLESYAAGSEGPRGWSKPLV